MEEGPQRRRGVVAPLGFRAAAVACGVKGEGALDLCLVASSAPAPAAGVFTQNRFQAAPVRLTRQHLAGGRLAAVCINAGNANCATPTEDADAQAMAEAVARALGVRVDQVGILSTGVIGVPLPRERVLAGIAAAASRLGDADGLDAARAIITTDTRPKLGERALAAGGGTVRIGAMAKGSGMIHPNLATLLALVTTDADLAAEDLVALVREAADASFNRVTVDGDQSTNDSFLLWASGASGVRLRPGHPDFSAFRHALLGLCDELARAVAADGEGASRFLEVEVAGAASDREARWVARAVATSPLVKTAVYGADPNVGRVLAALGNAVSDLDPGTVGVAFGAVEAVRAGKVIAFDEQAAREELARAHVLLRIHLGRGTGCDRAYTCDLTEGYIAINAHYRS